MKHFKRIVKGNSLTIEVDLSKEYGRSSSGKSTIFASTEGNQSVPETDDLKMGLNIYTT